MSSSRFVGAARVRVPLRPQNADSPPNTRAGRLSEALIGFAYPYANLRIPHDPDLAQPDNSASRETDRLARLGAPTYRSRAEQRAPMSPGGPSQMNPYVSASAEAGETKRFERGRQSTTWAPLSLVSTVGPVPPPVRKSAAPFTGGSSSPGQTDVSSPDRKGLDGKASMNFNGSQ